METSILPLIQGASYMGLVGLSWIAFGFVMGRVNGHKIHAGLLIALYVTVMTLCSGGLGVFTSPMPELNKGFWLACIVLFLCGASNFFQLILMSKAMANGPNGIIWALIQSAFVFPFMMGIFCFGARASVANVSGIVMLLVALAIMGSLKDRTATGPWRLPTYLAFACTAWQMVGGNIPSYFEECREISSCWRNMFCSAGMAFMSIAGTAYMQRGRLRQMLAENFSNRHFWTCLATLTIPELIANIVFYYPGLDLLAKAGVGGIATPICVSVSIIGMEIYSLCFLKEKRSLLQNITLVLMLVGTAALCL